MSKKKGKKVNLRHYAIKFKDLSDIISPKYRRYYGLRTEITDKYGNPKIIYVAEPKDLDIKINKRSKRRYKKSDYITFIHKKLHGPNYMVLQLNKREWKGLLHFYIGVRCYTYVFAVEDLPSWKAFIEALEKGKTNIENRKKGRPRISNSSLSYKPLKHKTKTKS